MANKEAILQKVDELKDDLMDKDSKIFTFDPNDPKIKLATCIQAEIGYTKPNGHEPIIMAETLQHVLYLGSVQEQKRRRGAWSQEVIDLTRELIVGVYDFGIRDASRRESRNLISSP